jgi:catechol 2,3-dioxygenase-like lactoylglutathione lyase family enzyme
MSITRVDNVFYFVNNMAESVAFYQDVLGLDLVYRGDVWSSFEVGGVTLGLHARASAAPAAPQSPHAGGQVSLASDEIEKDVARLKSQGVTFLGEIVREAWADLAAFRDPSGNVLNLRQAKS